MVIASTNVNIVCEIIRTVKNNSVMLLKKKA